MFERVKRWLGLEGTVYKVVRTDAFRTSCVVEGRARTTYKQGAWSEAPRWLAGRGYWLTCFKTYADARFFGYGQVLRGCKVEIWECSARRIKRRLPRMCNIELLAKADMEPFGNWAHWPPGTIMAKQVRLERCVCRLGR